MLVRRAPSRPACGASRPQAPDRPGRRQDGGERRQESPRAAQKVRAGVAQLDRIEDRNGSGCRPRSVLWMQVQGDRSRHHRDRGSRRHHAVPAAQRVVLGPGKRPPAAVSGKPCHGNSLGLHRKHGSRPRETVTAATRLCPSGGSRSARDARGSGAERPAGREAPSLTKKCSRIAWTSLAFRNSCSVPLSKVSSAGSKRNVSTRASMLPTPRRYSARPLPRPRAGRAVLRSARARARPPSLLPARPRLDGNAQGKSVIGPRVTPSSAGGSPGRCCGSRGCGCCAIDARQYLAPLTSYRPEAPGASPSRAL